MGYRPTKDRGILDQIKTEREEKNKYEEENIQIKEEICKRLNLKPEDVDVVSSAQTNFKVTIRRMTYLDLDELNRLSEIPKRFGYKELYYWEINMAYPERSMTLTAWY